jgi:hypothetical protein
MKSTIWINMCIAGLLLAGTAGCGGSSDPGQGDGADSSSTAPDQPNGGATTPKVAKVPPKDAGPDAIVKTFLDSLRDGDDATAEALLTERARIETEKAELKVQPPGSATARYAVGAVQYVTQNNDGAHVGSVWEDVGAGGGIETYEVTWVLRSEADGWRIVGMATQPAPGFPDIFLNFENPQDMLARVQQVNADQEARTAQNPQNPPNPDTLQR